MNLCAKCGAELKEDDRFCSKCGSAAQQFDLVANGADTSSANLNSFAYKVGKVIGENSDKVSKPSRRKVVILIAIVCVLLCAFGAFCCFNSYKESLTTRETGKLPNALAVMDDLATWDKAKFSEKNKLNNDVAVDLSNKVLGATEVWISTEGSEGSDKVLVLYGNYGDGSTDDDYTINSNFNVYKGCWDYTSDLTSSRLFCSVKTNDGKKAMNNLIPSAFDSYSEETASKLLSLCSVNEYEVISENVEHAIFSDAFTTDIQNFKSSANSTYGNYYSLIGSAKTPSGNTCYFELTFGDTVGMVAEEYGANSVGLLSKSIWVNPGSNWRICFSFEKPDYDRFLAVENGSTTSSQSEDSSSVSQADGSSDYDSKYYSIDLTKLPEGVKVKLTADSLSVYGTSPDGSTKLLSGYLTSVVQKDGTALFSVLVASSNWSGLQGDYSSAVLPDFASEDGTSLHVVVAMGNSLSTHKPTPFTLKDGTIINDPQAIIDQKIVVQK